MDGGRRTLIRLKNTTERVERAFLQVRHEGGLYTPEAVELGAWESVSIDLAALRESGEPDLAGATLPPNAESGQLIWYAERPGALIGRAEVRDDRLAVASSFSCEPICCGLEREEAFMDPGSAVDVVGNEGYPFGAKETRRDCYGIIFGPYDMSDESDWASSDSSVASVSSGGLVSCLSGGSAGITASWESTVGYSHYPTVCLAIVAGAVAGATMQVNEPTLTGPSGVTRGSSATYTIQNTTASSQISGWNYSTSFGTVNRTSNTGSTSWSGTMVTGGTVGVTVVQGGQTYNLSRGVTVDARSGFAFTAVQAQQVSNGFNPQLTLPATPAPGDEAGRFDLLQDFHVVVNTVNGGPNHSFHYVQSITNGAPPTSYRWVIADDADNTSSTFSQAQCGNYDPQQNPNGFISGAQLRANIIHHESNGQSNSHYHNYRVSQDNTSNNVGLTAESEVGPPSMQQGDFLDNVRNLLMQKEMTIGNDTTVEPCQGDTNRNHAGNCEYQGNVNYPPYQSCP